MLIRSRLAVGACVAVLLTAGCGQRGSDAPAAESTLATVGDAAVSTDEVLGWLDPDGQEMPVRFPAGSKAPGGEAADPLELALDAAIKDELLALEAERRGIEGVNRSQKLSKLLDAEVRSKIEEFDEDEVRAWYDDHRYLFDEVVAAELEYVVLDSPAALDDVLAGLDDGLPHAREAVNAQSVVEGGPLTMSKDGPEVPLMIERVVNAAMYSGAFAYDLDPATGNWWVVEVRDITLEQVPWNPQLATKVETAMRWEAEQDLISDWTSSLQEEWPVAVDEQRVERFDRAVRGA